MNPLKHSNPEEVLNSLEGISRAEASPFLYNKILHRISENREQMAPARLVWLAAASFVILIVLNWQVLKNKHTTTNPSANQTETITNGYDIYPTNSISYN